MAMTLPRSGLAGAAAVARAVGEAVAADEEADAAGEEADAVGGEGGLAAGRFAGPEAAPQPVAPNSSTVMAALRRAGGFGTGSP
ncbi:MAG: hypothetical protein LBI49_26440 [Nocardiopsaceae bacterium]|nr:hypothetical protein [Nocardiopsaceae bacterium]